MKEKGTYALERALVHVFQHNVDGAVTNEKTLTSNDTKKKRGKTQLLFGVVGHL